jgi:hypothetical protein
VWFAIKAAADLGLVKTGDVVAVVVGPSEQAAARSTWVAKSDGASRFS